MRTGSILFLLGIILLIQLPVIPPAGLSVLLPLFVVLLLKARYLRWPAWFLCGFLWALFRADIIISENLEKNLEGELLLVEGKVVSLPVYRNSMIRFDFLVNNLLDSQGNQYNRPKKIRLNWYQNYPDIVPGEYWRLQVKLKRPYGFMNPGGFDYEGYLFQQRIGATGYVINRNKNIRLAAANMAYIHQIRFNIREKLDQMLGNKPVKSLISALVIGDRSAITQGQWQILTQTGTNHLLAISGLHIGLIAGLAFLITRWLWPVLGSISFSVAGPRIASLNAVIAALIYAALAGFSVPTQRALIMLAIVLLLTSINRVTRSTNVVALALFIILIIDPLTVMSAGFWLSFMAIIVILYGMASRTSADSLWWRWGRVQWLVAVGLMPLLILWFQQIPTLSILANIIAVPWVSILTIPLVLVGMSISFIHEEFGSLLLSMGANTLELLWGFLEFISNFEAGVLQTAFPSVPVLFAASIGVLLLLMPKGLPGRWLGLIWMLPLLVPSHDFPEEGQFNFILLDVGQGLAAVVHTKNHTLIYDTGPKYSDRFDAGSGVILPYLKYKGVSKIDMLIASHGDSDHVGGLPQLLAGIEIENIISSVPEKIKYPDVAACRAGDNWQWDNVSFMILHPQNGQDLSGNNLSCVLQIKAGNYSILLTGDIERRAEQKLVTAYGQNLESNVLIAPHHGSKTSSSIAFINAVQPQYVLFPVGYRNRFSFPKKDIIGRYQSRGAINLNTAKSGAIEIGFDEEGINIIQYRQRSRRFWHSVF